MSKFKVGDIIIYLGVKNDYPGEMNLKQVVVGIDNDDYYTTFLDSGKGNCFGVNSPYAGRCILHNNLNKGDLNYSNGVPMIWGDDI